jgi:hypothetical protein
MENDSNNGRTITVNTEPGRLLPPSQRQKRVVLQPISPDLKEATMAQPHLITVSRAVSNPVVSTHASTNEVTQKPVPVYPEPGINAFSSSPSEFFTRDGRPIADSQLNVKKKRLPVGVYLIVGWSLFSFVVSLFNTSEDSLYFSMVLFTNSLLGIGLLFGLEIARRSIVWLFGILAVLSVIILLMLTVVQAQVHQVEYNYNAAVSHVNQQNFDETGRQRVTAMKAQVTLEQKKEGRSIALAYTEYGLQFLIGIVAIVYLRRTKVREAF